MKTEYELLLKYSELMTKKNLSGFRNNITNAHDFVAIAYEKTFIDYDNAVKIIRNAVINEKRRLIGQIQSQMIFDRVGEKRCGCCKQNKSYQEFRKCIDYKTNYQYFNSKCNDCQKQYDNSDKRKEVRKINYANSPNQKAAALVRYKRFMEKKKALKFNKLIVSVS